MAEADDRGNQDTLVDEPPLSVKVDKEDLVSAIESANEIVDELRFHITPDEMHALAVDPANVIAFDTGKIDVDANKPATIGVDCEDLLDKIEWVPGYSETVTLEVKDEDELQVCKSVVTESTELIDPESIRKDPDLEGAIERVDFEAVGEAEGWEFVGSIAKVALPARNSVRMSVSGGSVVVEGDREEYDEDGERTGNYWGFTDEFEVDLERSPDVDDDAMSLFSSGMVMDLVQALPSEGPVKFWLGDDVPLVAESSVGSRVIVAPRINDPTEDS